MMMRAVREGFALANRNMKLVAVKVAVSLLNFIMLIFFVGVPVGVAVIYLGYDADRLEQLIPSMAADPLQLVSNYAGLVALLGVSLFLYMVLISIVWLYVEGGVIGVLNRSYIDSASRPGLSDFFRAGSDNFGPLLRVISLTLLFVIAALVAALAISLLTMIIPQGGAVSVFVLFVRTFVSVAALMVAVTAGLGCLIVTVYAMVISVADRLGAVATLRKTFSFLGRRVSAVFFPLLIWLVVALAYTGFYAFQSFLHLVPVIGALLGFGMYFLSLAFQAYLSVALWGMFIAYYHHGRDS